MYFIERRGPNHQWIRELNFKTEFKALIGARRKAISTLATYRIVHAMWPNQAVCYVDGPALANEAETKGSPLCKAHPPETELILTSSDRGDGTNRSHMHDLHAEVSR